MFTACMTGGESHPPQCHFMSAVILRVDLYNFYTFYTPGTIQEVFRGLRQQESSAPSKKCKEKQTYICLKSSDEPVLWESFARGCMLS